MLKGIVAGIMVLIFTVGSEAEELSVNDKILGIEVGAAKIEADTFGPFGESDHEENDVEFGIRIGAQNEEWRTLLILNYFDTGTKSDQEYIKGLVTFDYLLMKKSTFKPYIGINLGYINYTTSGMDDENGFLYGAQAGMLYRIADNIQVDLTYRYSFSESDHVNHVEGIVFGLNYMF